MYTYHIHIHMYHNYSKHVDRVKSNNNSFKDGSRRENLKQSTESKLRMTF